MLSDSIADLLTRIRNGYLARKLEIIVPHSKLKEAIVTILAKNGYVKQVEVVEDKKKKQLKIMLAYTDGKAAITHIERISKAGRRLYSSKDKLPHVLSDLGIAIISTPKGVMTEKEARQQGLGGEIMCYVW